MKNKITEQRRKLVRLTQKLKHVNEFKNGKSTLKSDIAKKVAAAIYSNKFKDYPELNATEDLIKYGEKRQETKIGRWIKSRFDCKDEEISSYIELFKNYKDEPQVEIITGKDIYKYYRTTFGSKSCMSRKPREYFEIYMDNPDKFQLVVSLNPYKARAMTFIGDSGRKYYCSIYGPSKTLINYFNNSDYKYLYSVNNMSGNDSITIPYKEYEKYPFFDAFRYSVIVDEKYILYNLFSTLITEHKIKRYNLFNTTNGALNSNRFYP